MMQTVAIILFAANVSAQNQNVPAVAEEVEKRGLTAEQIHEDPTILLEILDKSLQ